MRYINSVGDSGGAQLGSLNINMGGLDIGYGEI